MNSNRRYDHHLTPDTILKYLKAMKRLLLFGLLILVFLFSSSAQDVKSEAKDIETKMDVFTSKTGTIVKFIDYQLSDLSLFLGETAQTRIRKMMSGGETSYFYQISKAGKYSTNTASIEYSDLLEVIKAFQTLNESVETDKSNLPDYLENMFITEDGFQVGYYVSNGKAKWYMKLDKYGSDNIILINDPASIEAALTGAKSKIESLKTTQ